MDVSAENPSFISTDTRSGKYWFHELNPPPGPGLTVVCAGREVCVPDYRIDRRNFHYHAVELVVGGTWKLTHKGRTELLSPGALFAYGPDTEFSLEASGGSELIKYFVTFSGADSGKRIKQCGLAGCRVLYSQQLQWIQDLFDQLLDCGRLRPEAAGEIGTSLNELILMRIAADAWAGDERHSESLRTFTRCRAFIHESYLEVASVAEIAGRCHVDPAYLARLFKRFSSERPLQLLTRLKTQHAADLIRRRGYSVKAAAEAVGYPDPYHFSRVFKRIHGVSPSGIQRR